LGSPPPLACDDLEAVATDRPQMQRDQAVDADAADQVLDVIRNGAAVGRRRVDQVARRLISIDLALR
jgi:hypothetical protein